MWYVFVILVTVPGYCFMYEVGGFTERGAKGFADKVKHSNLGGASTIDAIVYPKPG
jgi:hypothetical protein